MNDNSDYDLPEWAFDIYEKYGLFEKSDQPLGGVIVLLSEAADVLEQAATTMVEELAAAPDMVQLAENAATMVQDALKLASICSTEPKPGVLERQADGSLIRKPR